MIRRNRPDFARVLDALGIRSATEEWLGGMHGDPSPEDAARAVALVLSNPRPRARASALLIIARHLRRGHELDVSALRNVDRAELGVYRHILATIDGPATEARAELAAAAQSGDADRLWRWVEAELDRRRAERAAT